ncbi:TIM-barrel domain-containing protein [Rugosimonospora africana]|nr:TIM-barrel domain-containing protein [Rugosimonospora africana]
MPYRPPLVPHELFVADPIDLPVRPPGAGGLSALVRAELVATDRNGVSVKAVTADGQVLTAEISAAGEGVVRVRLAQDLDVRSRSATVAQLVRPATDPQARVEVEDRRVRLRTGPLTAEITLDPWHLRFLDGDGRVLVAEDPGEVDISGRMRTLPLGRSTVDGVVAAYHESFAAAADEHFVGLGEKFTGFDKRGQRVVMWNYDAFGAESERSYKNVPFYLSSRGYGVLVDSGTATEFDICHSTHSSLQIVVPDDLIDYYVLAGPTPARVLARFDRLTGAPTLPPKWAFGTWISSGFFVDTQEAVLARARRIRASAIPCDVLHLDCYWQTEGHWSDLRWDAERFPDPAGMLATLAESGFRVCLWINPYISQFSPDFADAAERGYFLRRADGSVYIADVWHGSHPASGIVDFTNPAASAWYCDRLRGLLEQGVAVFKTDFAEGVPVDSVASNGMSGTVLHNVYSLLYNDAVADATRQVAGHSMVWARSSFLGGQRHCAQWSGDTNASYPAMASTLRGGLSHGLSGVPFWSHDVGGFYGTPVPDLYSRWAGFGALSPLVRFHGTTSRLPWEFPPEAERDAVAALRLRYELMPYLYSAATDSARTGLPMMRPLLVEYPDDPAAWQADLEYLLGPDLLVAPMTDPAGVRRVYLPEGDWVDYWTGTAQAGGRYVTIADDWSGSSRGVRRAEPDWSDDWSGSSRGVGRVPLFVRLGALIATTDAGDTVGDGAFGDLTLVSWAAGGDGETGTVVSDVSGDTRITAVRQDTRLDIVTDGPARVHGVVFAPVAGAQPPEVVTVDGVVATLETVDGRLTARLA